MLILGQDKDIIVNLDNIDTIVVDGGYIKAYNGSLESNTLIGKYSVDRAKEILKDILRQYRFRQNSANIYANCVYEMPKE